MSSINTDEYMPDRLVKAIANPLFPALDSELRAGKHISTEDMDNHALLCDFENELTQFYQRYNTELIKAPEGFFYLRPRSTTLISRSVLSELDMLVGKVLCFLYLSPERLAHEGIFTNQELYEELLALADEKKLMRLVTLRASGSDLDREKLFDKVKTSMRRLKRLGMITSIGEEGKFRISESVFRFGADVRLGDELKEAQLRLIRDGEAVIRDDVIKNDKTTAIDDTEQNDQIDQTNNVAVDNAKAEDDV